ncbi:hypothetical protein ACIQ7Q_02415 [Streptomyces sp. NPDC096176]
MFVFPGSTRCFHAWDGKDGGTVVLMCMQYDRGAADAVPTGRVQQGFS